MGEKVGGLHTSDHAGMSSEKADGEFCSPITQGFLGQVRPPRVSRILR